jgi:hypothetical protein
VLEGEATLILTPSGAEFTTSLRAELGLTELI